MLKYLAEKREVFIKYSAALNDEIKTEKWFKKLEDGILRQDPNRVKTEEWLFEISDKLEEFETFQGIGFFNIYVL